MFASFRTSCARRDPSRPMAMQRSMGGEKGLGIRSIRLRSKVSSKVNDRHRRPTAAAGAASEGSSASSATTLPQQLSKIASAITISFPLWTVLSACAALVKPEAYAFMSTEKFTGALAILYAFWMEFTSAYLLLLVSPFGNALSLECCFGLYHVLGRELALLCTQDAFNGHNSHR